jgi:hypothetical protein
MQLVIFLQLCKSVAPQVNLQMMCQWFFTSQFYEGVLDLVLVCASKLDPRNVGFDYYKNKEPGEDSEGYQAFLKRYFTTGELCAYILCILPIGGVGFLRYVQYWPPQSCATRCTLVVSL